MTIRIMYIVHVQQTKISTSIHVFVGSNVKLFGVVQMNNEFFQDEERCIEILCIIL